MTVERITDESIAVASRIPGQEVIERFFGDELAVATEFMMGREVGEYTKQRKECWQLGVGSRVRWEGSVMKAHGNLVTAGAAMVVDAFDSGSQEEAVAQLDQAYFSALPEDNELKTMPLRVLAAAEKVFKLRNYAADLRPTITEVMRSPGGQYNLMQMFSHTVPYKGQSAIEESIWTVQVLSVFDAETNGPTSAAKEIARNLDEGAFDEFIAKELLVEVTNPPAEQLRNGEAELYKMLKLSGRLTGDSTSEAIQKLSRSGSIELWPSVCKQAISTRRNRYAQFVKDNYEECKAYLDEYYCLLPDKDERAVGEAVEVLAHEVDLQKSSNTYLPPQERIVSQVRAQTRRRQRQAAAGKAAVEASTTPEEEQTIGERKIVYVNPSGEEKDSDTDEYKKLKEDYLSEHEGDEALRKDVDNMIDYLKKIQFTDGLPRGIKKLSQGVKRGSTRFRKLYELKPSEAVNLPTGSPRASKVRIVFALSESKVSLLGITDKDQFSALERKLGFSGKARRR